jgi:hypothetical protein
MIRGLDQLAAFDEFVATISPELRKDLQSGASAEDIYLKYTAYAAARGVSIAMTERDTSKALKAIQDILDRTKGKAVQRVEAKHKFEDLSEDQLDALLQSRLKDVIEVEVGPDDEES